jgi:hypothetical protein
MPAKNAPEKIVIDSELHDPAELRAALEAKVGDKVSFSTEPSGSTFRTDPTILVALITAGSVILAALIKAVGALPARRPRVIRVETSGGHYVDVPADADEVAITAALGGLGPQPVVRIVLRQL